MSEAALEGGPVLEVQALTNGFAEGDRMFSPGSPRNPLVPCLEVVERARQEDWERAGHQHMVGFWPEILLEPAPLTGVEHGAPTGLHYPAGTGVDHQQAGVT